MTREETKELLPIIQAWAEGKSIQFQTDSKSWSDITKDLYPCNHPSLYRVKPEPKYRSFKNHEECWQEMLKHQPFGWIKDVSKYVEIVGVYKNDIEFSPDADDDGILFRYFLTFESVLKQGYTFIDGTPFGIKEE